ncbi:GH92 family glycosyl hydrolase [Kitasatospora azatica]|uniref:GH92 family glycosyl hydrolase n=1 Tax=Kitasatospora azatica TaxID=58347 RepID=UPI0009FF4854|nr:GH92 family glycosyl hydrolase [Kitasatospora azatica]
MSASCIQSTHSSALPTQASAPSTHTPTNARGAVARITVNDPAQWVNTFVGTQQGAVDYGNGGGAGNTFPGAVAPLGMIQWSPDTVTYQHGGYDYDDNRIRGFSLTHISGAGCGDYGNVPFLPFLGSGSPGYSTFSHSNESSSPGTYSVTFDNGIRTDLAVTQRSGIAQFSYPAGQTASLTVDAGKAFNAATGSVAVSSNGIAGYTDSGNFCGTGNHYRLFFSVVFDHPFASSSVSGGSSAQVSFDTSANRTVTAKVGISFVSADNAYANLQAEQGGYSFSQVSSLTRGGWNGMLGRIAVAGGNIFDTVTFYSALYHALQDPSVFSDTDGRYPGFDGQLHTVPAGHAEYADFSGWDVYRSQAQLLALLAPQQASDVAQSIVNQGAQAGYLDRWTLANGNTGVMIGDPLPIIGSNLFAFGATDFDYWSLLWQSWQGTVKDNERPGQASEHTEGFVPNGIGWGAAAATLEYATADFAISQLAGRLGDTAIHDVLLHQSSNWRDILNQDNHYLQPRNADHSWPGFDPTSQSGWVEGNGAQYTWLVPQNPKGLIAALGGPGPVVSRLDSLFGNGLNAGPNSAGAYLGNEPSSAIPWLYDYAGRPDRTEAVVRQALTTLFSWGPNGEVGNDDLGQMSAWAVWAAVGMYPEIPGRAELALASPLFPAITISRGNGVTIDITAPGATGNTPYVTSLQVNGSWSQQPWLSEDFVQHGGTLAYGLSSTDSPGWGTAAANAPPSFDTGPAMPVTGPITGLAGKCVDDYHSQTSWGNKIQIWDCNGTGAQQWTLASDGSVQVLGSCLDVVHSGTTAGNLVDLWPCNGTGAQQWWPRSDGSLVNPPSGLCLDLPNSNTTDGTQLQIWGCNGTGAQRWTVPH